MNRNVRITFLCGAAFVTVGSLSSVNALADDAVPAPMPLTMRNVLMWDQVEGGHMVDVEAAKSVNANVINVAAVPHGIGNWIGSVKPLAAYEAGMKNGWKADLDELNKAGIAVWTSFNTTAFEPEVFTAYGMDPELYYARNEKGEPEQNMGGSYSKEGKVFSSCPNNPNWMALERDITLLFADNGFGGVLYDLGILADDAVMFCHCDYCKTKWKAHLTAKGQDPATPLPLPGSGRDMIHAVNRDHLRWRFACIDEDWMIVRNAVKAKYPDFVLGPNSSDKEPDNTAAAAIMGQGQVYDFLDFEEWGHSGAPYSIACSYLLGRADGAGKPVVVCWNGGDIHTDNVQARIALAEAPATGEFTQNFPGAVEFNDFLLHHEGYFADSTSAANVGVVYSAWSREFYDVPRKSHAYYWFGQMLLDMHVPFEYLLAEHDLTPETLSRYKALILPDVGCLSNDQVGAITAYVKGGGAIYATHKTGNYDEDLLPRTPGAIEALAGHSTAEAFRAEVGGGRIAYNPGLPEKDHWEKNLRDLNKSKKLSLPTPPPADVTDALEWVFQKNLPIEIEAKSSTMVTVRRKEDRLLIHLVNYNTYPDGNTLTPDRNIAIRLDIPADSDVASVVAITPDLPEDRTVEGWIAEDGKLSMTLDELQTYTVVAVNLKPKNPKVP